jgi:thioredoxin 1
MNCKAFIIPALIVLATVTCSAKDIQQLKNKNDIKNAINNNDMLVIKYGTKWCGPCKQVDKILPELASEFKKIQFAKVDVEEVKADGIQTVPFIEFYLNHKKAHSFTGSKAKGAFTAEINKTFNCCK